MRGREAYASPLQQMSLALAEWFVLGPDCRRSALYQVLRIYVAILSYSLLNARSPDKITHWQKRLQSLHPVL